MTGSGNCPRHSHQFTPAQTAQRLQRVSRCVERDTACNHVGLARQPLIIHASAAPCPIRGQPPEHSRRDCRSRGGITNAHFTGHQKVGVGVNGSPAGLQCRHKFAFGHRGRCREIGRRRVQRQRIDIHLGTESFGQLIDGRAAMFKVGDHLCCHLGRKGRDTLRAHPVVACKDDDLRCGDLWPRIAAPAGIPDCQILQPSQRAGRFCQLPIAVLRALAGVLVRAGCRGQQIAEAGNGRKWRLHQVLARVNSCPCLTYAALMKRPRKDAFCTNTTRA